MSKVDTDSDIPLSGSPGRSTATLSSNWDNPPPPSQGDAELDDKPTEMMGSLFGDLETDDGDRTLSSIPDSKILSTRRSSPREGTATMSSIPDDSGSYHGGEPDLQLADQSKTKRRHEGGSAQPSSSKRRRYGGETHAAEHWSSPRPGGSPSSDGETLPYASSTVGQGREVMIGSAWPAPSSRTGSMERASSKTPQRFNSAPPSPVSDPRSPSPIPHGLTEAGVSQIGKLTAKVRKWLYHVGYGDATSAHSVADSEAPAPSVSSLVSSKSSSVHVRQAPLYYSWEKPPPPRPPRWNIEPFPKNPTSPRVYIREESEQHQSTTSSEHEALLDDGRFNRVLPGNFLGIEFSWGDSHASSNSPGSSDWGGSQPPSSKDPGSPKVSDSSDPQSSSVLASSMVWEDDGYPQPHSEAQTEPSRGITTSSPTVGLDLELLSQYFSGPEIDETARIMGQAYSTSGPPPTLEEVLGLTQPVSNENNEPYELYEDEAALLRALDNVDSIGLGYRSEGDDSEEQSLRSPESEGTELVIEGLEPSQDA